MTKLKHRIEEAHMRFKDMISNKRFHLRAVASLMVVCFLATAIAWAQTGSPALSTPEGERQTLKALLDEVHQLRVALQRSSVNTARVQLAFERMRLQLGRVDALSRELEGVRSQLVNVRENRAQTAERIKDLEEQINQTADASRRAQMERQLNLTKQGVSSQSRREDQLRDRETQLGGQLQVEQSKLSELEGQLGNLERELSTP
jgi:predicted  nucleic acid-binding Zn-ribbon protein